MSLEDTLRIWASPPSETERQKCDNAVTAIRKAISASDALSRRDINVFAQGSYRNNTNVRYESDVDICVVCNDTFFYDLNFAQGLTTQGAGIGPTSYEFSEFKSDVEAALRSYLGHNAVNRGNKAFDVHANTYRVDADVVACFEHRRYSSGGSYISGTEFACDSGKRIINWPEQNYQNGVSKNNDTGRRYKSGVRILKRLRHKMIDENISEAKDISSYLVECLVWNVPNYCFGNDLYRDNIHDALAHLISNTDNYEKCKEWGEVNELKYLFHSSQPWTYQQAHNFSIRAWQYLGF